MGGLARKLAILAVAVTSASFCSGRHGLVS